MLETSAGPQKSSAFLPTRRKIRPGCSRMYSNARSVKYREIDCRIRRRVLKEIQIIIDAYVIAQQQRRVREWESMYGDIEHYRREFYYFRMDSDYEDQEKTLLDYKIIEE